VLACLVVVGGCAARSEIDGPSSDASGPSARDVSVQPGECPAGLPGPALVSSTTATQSPFCIDSTEVKNADYAEFLASKPNPSSQTGACASNTSFTPPFNWPAKDPNRPVVNVDWCDATAYCAWAGKELCGAPGRAAAPPHDFANAQTSLWLGACSSLGALTYPYGASFDPARCNGQAFGAAETLDVDQPPACTNASSPIHDMSGNAWEWENACEGDGATDRCRVRGGSFRSDEFSLVCSASTLVDRNTLFDDFGFRCCVE
jgi:formylglycine-generating enzyme required for sulfatase activity